MEIPWLVSIEAMWLCLLLRRNRPLISILFTSSVKCEHLHALCAKEYKVAAAIYIHLRTAYTIKKSMHINIITMIALSKYAKTIVNRTICWGNVRENRYNRAWICRIN